MKRKRLSYRKEMKIRNTPMSKEELQKWVDDHREETERIFELWKETQRPGITPKELRKLDRELKKNYAGKEFRVPADRKYPILNNVLAWQIAVFVSVLINFALQLAISIQKICEKWFW